MLPIAEQFLPADSPNTSHNPLTPVGLVIHETADPDATAQQESNFEHTQAPHTSAHYFVDDVSIIQNLPETVVAWHAGPTANDKFLSIELCHFNDAKKFAKTWSNAVDLAAHICHQHGFDPTKTIHSHAWVSETYGESNHTDPIGYFEQHGKTFEEFVNAVVVAVKELTPEPSAPEPVEEKESLPPLSLPFGYMSEGAHGEHVQVLQEALNRVANAGLTTDGVFGPATDKALRAFQKKYKLTVDGVYGDKTKVMLQELLR